MYIDNTQILIMIYSDKFNKWQDCTKTVQWVKQDIKSVRIKFYNNDKFYYKSYAKINIYRDPKVINKVLSKLYIKGRKALDTSKILLFGYDYYKIFFKDGNICTYHISEVNYAEEMENDRYIHRFEYFNDLSKEIQSKENTFLSDQYDRVNPFNRNSILHKYLKASNVYKNRSTDMIIYPFGLNLSQKAAVENALSYNVSIIEGPPGTGKTQTILNIICNCIYQNKTIAIVSNNNAAIENIKDKLKEEHYDFLSALLGNVENKTVFFDEIVNKPKPLNLLNEEFNDKKHLDMILKIKDYQDKIPKLYGYENKVAELNITLDHLSSEFNRFKIVNGLLESDIPTKIKKRFRTIKFINQFKINLDLYQKQSWYRNIIFRFRYGINIIKKTKDMMKLLYDHLDSLFYELKIKEIQKEEKQ